MIPVHLPTDAVCGKSWPRSCLRVTCSAQTQQACALVAKTLPSCGLAGNAPLSQLGGARALSWRADAPTTSEPSLAGDVSNVVSYGSSAPAAASVASSAASGLPSIAAPAAQAAAPEGESLRRSPQAAAATQAEASSAHASGATAGHVAAAAAGAAAQQEVLRPPPSTGPMYGGGGMAGSFPMPPLILPSWASEACCCPCVSFLTHMQPVRSTLHTLMARSVANWAPVSALLRHLMTTRNVPSV